MIRPRTITASGTFSVPKVLLLNANEMAAPAMGAPRPCRQVVRCDVTDGTYYLDANGVNGGMKDLLSNVPKHQRADHTID